MIGEELAGRYRLLARIAEGGMARVFLAEDLRQGLKVAVKLLRPELAEEPEWVARFRSEADTLSRLRHPNIVRFHDFFRDGARLAIAMEYAPGETLAARLPHHPDGLPWRDALALAGQVLSALQHIHAQGIVHRDIKPANLVVRAGHRVKLTDFGIARLRGSGGTTRTGFMAGTLKYMSPEQIQAQDLDGRSDLYSAALVLYELLCGRPAFDEPTEYLLARAQVESPPPPLRERRPDLPPRLESLILRALNKDPADRFDSATEFRRDLERLWREEHRADGRPPQARAARRNVSPSPQDPTAILPTPLLAAHRSGTDEQAPTPRVRQWAGIGREIRMEPSLPYPSKPMHVTLVHVHVKPEFIDPFIAATRANHEGSIQEPGNRRFDILQNPSDPARFILYEAYASAEDAAAHKQTPHYAAWRDAVAEMMAEPRQGVPMKGLYPEG